MVGAKRHACPRYRYSSVTCRFALLILIAASCSWAVAQHSTSEPKRGTENEPARSSSHLNPDQVLTTDPIGAVTQKASQSKEPTFLLSGQLERGPADALVTIIEFSDFECPFCGSVEAIIQELLRSYPHQIRFVFKHNPLPIHSKAQLAHEAALAAAAQGKFWEMHDLLFANQTRLDRGDLEGYAKRLNLDMEAFTRALDDHSYRALVDQDLTDARGLGVNATPTFFISGRKLVGAQSLASFKAIIDEEISPKLTPRSDSRVPLDPYELSLTEAPVRGSPDAPVTIVEFSDFQCPYCAAVRPTLDEILKEYHGRVRLVFKHFPLDFHENAFLAHQAALAANEQGKFWEMHDRIFANQRAMKRDDLIRTARDLGLDMDRFVADMDSGRFQPTVEANKKEGTRLGVNGTPSFVVNGKFLEGALPLAEFRKIVAEALGTASTAEAAKIDIGKAAQTAEAAEVSAGPIDAPVTIVWFSDLRSPLASSSSQLIHEAMGAFPGKIRVVFKNFPLQFHADAFLAHEAVLAAGAQGKFWEMEELIIRNQAGVKEDELIRYAVQLRLDKDKFVTSLNNGAYRGAVEKDLADGQNQNVRGAPVFFINGKRIDGIQPLALFKQTIETELKQTIAAN